MHRNRAFRTAGCAVLLLPALVLAGCDVVVGTMDGGMGPGAAQASDTWTRSYTLGQSPRLEVMNVNGLLTFEAWEGDTVEVSAERRARARSEEEAKELLGKVEIVETVTSDHLRLETKQPRGWRGGSAEVRYSVRVPAGANLNVRTTNGEVRVTGVTGEVRAETTNGAVVGSALSGAVRAETTNGRIRIELDAIAGDGLRLETTNGGIELRIPAEAQADIAARCVNGSIKVSDLQVAVREQSRRRLDATLNGGGPRVELETTNGSISLNRKGN
jgi:hypothetical protein